MADENLNTPAGNHQAGGEGVQPSGATPGTEATPPTGTPTEGTDTNGTEAKATDTDTGKAGGAPEAYDLTLPEDGHLSEAAKAAVESYAREHGLSNEAAQQALELGNAQVSEYVEARQAEWQKTVHEDWPEQLKNDPEFGGDNFEANADLAKQALDKFGPPGFADVLNETGFGNHPMLLKWALNVGRAMAEDDLVTGNKGGGEPSMADRLFGK